YDKFGTRNPLARWMMLRFGRALDDLVRAAAPNSIHEIGCGEGYWVLRWLGQKRMARGSDFSSKVIDLARLNARECGFPADGFQVRSIYQLDPANDSADLLVCCEVLEHLENPVLALQLLRSAARCHVILSVPREPLWRWLNIARGAYWGRLGNTPGHLQHWTRRGFIRLVEGQFEVLAVRTPIPW